MAIRIRIVDGFTVALCAAVSTPKKGDIYLGDGAHHALSTKFGLDFKSMGFLKDAMADERLVPIMLKEQGGELDGRKGLQEWLKKTKPLNFFAPLRDRWFSVYQTEFGTAPTFTGADGANLKQLISKIKSKTIAAEIEWNEENALAGFEAILQTALKDKWLKDHFDLKIINSKFNEIYAKGKSNSTSSNEFDQQIKERFGEQGDSSYQEDRTRG